MAGTRALLIRSPWHAYFHEQCSGAGNCNSNTRPLLWNYNFITIFISGALLVASKPLLTFERITKSMIFWNLLSGWDQNITHEFGDRFLEPSACVERSCAIWNNREPYESLGVSGGHLEHPSIQESFQEVARKTDQGSGEHLTHHMLKRWSTYHESRWTPIPDWLIVGPLDTTNDDKARHTCVYVYVFLGSL